MQIWRCFTRLRQCPRQKNGDIAKVRYICHWRDMLNSKSVRELALFVVGHQFGHGDSFNVQRDKLFIEWKTLFERTTALCKRKNGPFKRKNGPFKRKNGLFKRRNGLKRRFDSWSLLHRRESSSQFDGDHPTYTDFAMGSHFLSWSVWLSLAIAANSPGSSTD